MRVGESDTAGRGMSHFLPLLTLPLVYVLIPNKTMTERVVGADMGVDESGIASFNFKSWGMGVRDS